MQEYNHHISHMYHPITGVKETHDTLCAQDSVFWETIFTKTMVHISQGIGNHMKSGNENIFFIKHNQVPLVRKITYANPLCDYRHLKYNPYRF